MKKILIITYYWPPSGGSGVQRWMYFCKYLPQFGYDPVVLTVSEKKASYKNTDHSLVNDVKDVKTYRTNTFEPLKLYSFITSGSSTRGIPQGDVGADKKGLFHKLSAYIRGNFFIPDARIGWNYYALRRARKIIASQKINIVITTGPPHSTHLIGLQLKKEFPVKWIADLRDPWTDIYYNKDLKRTERSVVKDQLLEEKVLKHADRVLTIGIKLKELLQQKIEDNHDKFHHIYNGYDSFLMEENQVKPTDHFRITFIGLLTKSQPYTSLISVFRKFLDAVPEANFKICLAGNIQKEILNEIESEFDPSQIIYEGYVPHAEAISLMKRSHLLINVLAEMKESQILISGKQMEYIATGNAILCIGNNESEAATILKDIQNAMVIEKQQINEAADFVIGLYKKWEQGVLSLGHIENNNIKKMSRFETCRQLSQIINQI